MSSQLSFDSERAARSAIRALDAWRACPERLGYKRRSYELVPDGARSVLDVGCGTGDDALSLSEGLGADVVVVGIDRHLELIDEAWRRARNVALNVRFAVGDAHALPFADGTFDVVRADHLLQSVADPARVIRELARVAKVTGRILIHDDAAVMFPKRRPGEHALPQEDVLGLCRRAGLGTVELRDAWCGQNDRREQGASVMAVKARARRDQGGFRVAS